MASHRSLQLFLWMVGAGWVAGSVYSAETPPEGSALYQKNCQGCHDTSVFTRKTRKVTTLEGLGKQVRLCNHNLNIGWFDEETNAVIQHLNQSYYHFEATPPAAAPAKAAQ